MWEVVLGAAVALVGVVLTNWLTTLRDDRNRIRVSTKTLAFSIPILTGFYSDHPDSPQIDADYFGPYWNHRQEVLSMLNELRWLPRWPMRNARPIRENAKQLLLMLTAVEQRSQKGIAATPNDQFAIIAHDKLHYLVFGLKAPPDDELDRYVRYGFTMPEDDQCD